MNAVGAIRQILLEDATLMALLAPTAIYPMVLPQDKKYPAITLQVIDTRPNDSKTQVSPVDNIPIALTIYAKDYNKAQTIDDECRKAIDGFSGGITTSDDAVHDIRDVRFLSRKDEFDQENVLFIRQTVYDVRYYRDIPPLPFGPPYVSESKAWMKLLPVYDSDESAVADGLIFEDVYLTADNHVSGMGGVPKQVRIQT